MESIIAVLPSSSGAAQQNHEAPGREYLQYRQFVPFCRHVSKHNGQEESDASFFFQTLRHLVVGMDAN